MEMEMKMKMQLKCRNFMLNYGQLIRNGIEYTETNRKPFCTDRKQISVGIFPQN